MLDPQVHNRRMAGPRENLEAKGTLIAASLFVGIVIGVFTFCLIAYDSKEVTRQGFWGSYLATEWILNDAWLFGLFLALVFTVAASLLYPVVGVYLLSIRDSLRNNAYRITDKSEDEEQAKERIMWSAVWPVAFPCSVILYVFLILFNKLFDSFPE